MLNRRQAGKVTDMDIMQILFGRSRRERDFTSDQFNIYMKTGYPWGMKVDFQSEMGLCLMCYGYD